MPFFLLADPLGHFSPLIRPWRPATHSLGVSALGVDPKEGTGYFGPPWEAGTANPWAQGNGCWLLPPTAPLLSAAPSPHPPPTALRRGSRRAAQRSAACPGLAGLCLARDIKVSPGMCVALPGCERYGARDHERDTAMVIAPSNQGEAARQACQQYLLLFLPCAVLY